MKRRAFITSVVEAAGDIRSDARPRFCIHVEIERRNIETDSTKIWEFVIPKTDEVEALAERFDQIAKALRGDS